MSRREAGYNPGSVRRGVGLLLCALAFMAAGCHNNTQNSGYGVAFVTLTDEPGDFTTYTVNVDSVTLTRNDGAVVPAIQTVETVDFTKLRNVAALWGSASVATGTYVAATIVLDYTDAIIGVMVNGVPQKATVVNAAGTAVTTVTINVNLDPANLLTIVPTYATTAAQRLALDFNLPASTSSVNLATNPATVTVKPFFTAAIAAPDNKLIRVRGPLINSNVDLGTYTVEVRPFFDEENSLGSLTLFVDPTTSYVINGKVNVGTPGITQLSQSSAGTTVVAGYATYEPTVTPSATAAKFNVKYLVAGSTLEDVYTQGIEGDVVARNGNTLTLRGATLQINDGTSVYPLVGTSLVDATLIVGPNTIVTADDDASLTGLTSSSIAVGQHVIARGKYTLPTAGDYVVDATGNTSVNTGSVRLIPTSLWGSIVSSSAGNLLLNLQTINNYPAGDFVFTGNGATPPTAANFSVNTGALAVPDTTAGDLLGIDGLVAPFGAAPPDFTASAITTEATTPASLQVHWSGTGTKAPFSPFTATNLAIDLSNPSLASAVIRIGSESIALASLPASPTIVPQVVAETPLTSPTTLPPIFLPQYTFGDPTLQTPPAGVGLSAFSVPSTFVTQLTTALSGTAALQLEAHGTYDRATNTFSASSINVVL